MGKIVQNEAFLKLDKRRRDAVVMLFEGGSTDALIAQAVGRSRNTILNWKKDPSFQQALYEYRQIALDNAIPTAVQTLISLAASAKSEMVRLQAAMQILSLGGLGDGDTSVELQAAKEEKAKQDVRKSTAEADIMEAKAKREAGAEDGQANLLKKVADSLEEIGVETDQETDQHSDKS